MLANHCCHMQASRWTYSSDTALSPDRKIRANVVQRYHFSSNLRRMTATVEVGCSVRSNLMHLGCCVDVYYVYCHVESRNFFVQSSTSIQSRQSRGRVHACVERLLVQCVLHYSQNRCWPECWLWE